MIITFTSVDSLDENHHILSVEAEKGETIRVGQKVSIMMIDETYEEHVIASIQVGKLNQSKRRWKWMNVESISDGEAAEVSIYGIRGKVWATCMPTPAEMRRLDAMINIMPYKELHGGDESIYDHVGESFTVPDKVILYLQTKQPHMACPGIYPHPFKPEMQLLGPYFYTDDEYYWDRDAWKYVVKYHVTLPQKFIDKVMSDEGTAFLEKCAESNDSWTARIREWKDRKDLLCLLPEDAGDHSLEDF